MGIMQTVRGFIFGIDPATPTINMIQAHKAEIVRSLEDWVALGESAHHDYSFQNFDKISDIYPMSKY